MGKDLPELDIHVLYLDGLNPCWLAQCLGSIRYAMSLSALKVNLFVLPGVPGHLGQARMLGYGKGQAPYVSFIDSDDYILPRAFQCLEEPLRDRPDAIFPSELHWQNGYFLRGNQRHHLPIYARHLIIDQSEYKSCGDVAQIQSVANRNVVEIPEPVYVHRLYHSPARLLRRQHPDEYRRSLEYKPPVNHAMENLP